jgi:hypothetical protein
MEDARGSEDLGRQIVVITLGERLGHAVAIDPEADILDF